MTKQRRITACLGILSASLLLSGCSYYAITDPSTDRTYYTDDYDMESGAIMFRDDVTGAEVNIQNGEIMKISEEQYEAKVGE